MYVHWQFDSKMDSNSKRNSTRIPISRMSSLRIKDNTNLNSMSVSNFQKQRQSLGGANVSGMSDRSMTNTTAEDEIVRPESKIVTPKAITTSTPDRNGSKIEDMQEWEVVDLPRRVNDDRDAPKIVHEIPKQDNKNPAPVLPDVVKLPEATPTAAINNPIARNLNSEFIECEEILTTDNKKLVLEEINLDMPPIQDLIEPLPTLLPNRKISIASSSTDDINETKMVFYDAIADDISDNKFPENDPRPSLPYTQNEITKLNSNNGLDEILSQLEAEKTEEHSDEMDLLSETPFLLRTDSKEIMRILDYPASEEIIPLKVIKPVGDTNDPKDDNVQDFEVIPTPPSSPEIGCCMCKKKSKKSKKTK